MFLFHTWYKLPESTLGKFLFVPRRGKKKIKHLIPDAKISLLESFVDARLAPGDGLFADHVSVRKGFGLRGLGLGFTLFWP